MKKLKLLALLGVSICHFAQAQNYDFNQFKYRYNKNRGFNTYFNFNGQSEFNKYRSSDSIPSNPSNSNNLKRLSSDFKGFASLFYYQNINTDRLQQQISGSLVFENQSNVIHQNTFSISPSYSYVSSYEKSFSSKDLSLAYSSSSRYYRSNGKFLLLNYNLGYSTNINPGRNSENNSLNNPQGTNFNYTQSSGSYTVQLGFGNGRLEYVTDAIQAKFLILDLQRKAGLGKISNEQLENIARGMSVIRNKRFTDFRFSVIGQLEMLDSVLNANGASCGNSIAYFTTINDNWQYATRFGRYSGKRWTYALTSTGNNRNQNTRLGDVNFGTLNSGYNDKLLDNGVYTEYVNSFQKGLKIQWTHSLGFAASHQMYGFNGNAQLYDTTQNVQTTFTSQSRRNYTSSIYYQLSYLYQANTRTFLSLTAKPSLTAFYMYKGEINGNFNPQNKSLFQSLQFSAQYFRFVDARLNFVASLQGDLNNFNIKSDQAYSNVKLFNSQMYLGLSFNMGLNYAFF